LHFAQLDQLELCNIVRDTSDIRVVEWALHGTHIHRDYTWWSMGRTCQNQDNVKSGREEFCSSPFGTYHDGKTQHSNTWDYGG
jgi:hypothetical protein